MSIITKYHYSDFTPELILEKKGSRVIHVVFSTFGEREAEAVSEKISVLKGLPAGIIDRIILNHRRTGNGPDLTETLVSEKYSDVEILVSNFISVPDMGAEMGKGGDMRRTLYTLLKGLPANGDTENIVVIFLDADVLPEYFGTHFVTSLAGAVLNGADFAKGGFWREMGRVKKYVAQPLFSVIDHPSIRQLSEFSYPLSGECAGTLKFLSSVSFWQIYGVETGILIEAVSRDFLLADVNLGLYDHEHHGDLNIQKMSFGIIRTYLRTLMDEGIIKLEHGANVSDVFRAEYIDAEGERRNVEEDLPERKYPPLNDIVKRG